MHRYLIKIAFDGTDYHGWQVQPNGITVQEQLQNSMKALYGFSPDVTGCSRTDAGVHAECFFCHFDLEGLIPNEGVIKGLNSVLPDDIRVLECKEVDADFHSRYCAKKKTYLYRIDRRNISDPFSCRFSYRYDGKLNVGDMNYFCSTLCGEHDFEGFSSANRSVQDTVRTVYDCHISENGNYLELFITGNGFLYNMVRIVTGTALEVGKGKIDKNIAEKIFITKDRSIAGATAPAKGLFLKLVEY
ncbi:MAG: tRNA pseudouridine(38-40) synthase TruA [Clostridia bacterium]|nr:tRNA pseudouridine(38-40) synthase TruA [Clostridia bacterium]